MESYGEILRKRREEKEIPIETVERETTITRQYIEALEAEKVDVFPGEAYFIGFMKNYCDFLELDSNELIRLYQAKKIQESPVPTGLLEKKSSKPLVAGIVAAVVAVLVGTGIFLYFGVFKVPQKLKEQNLAKTEVEKIHQYTFSGRAENRRLYVGDQILVPAKDGKNNIVLTVSQTQKILAIETPAGSQIIELSEERELDADGDGASDLIVYLSDISDTDNSYGAEVRILQKKGDVVTVTENATETVNPSEIPDSAPAAPGLKRIVIHEDNRAYPFTVHATFRGSCLFRYKVDRQPNSEDYFKKDDVVNVTANNSIRLWMSNVNALKIQVIAGLQTYELEVGKAGQVKVEDIKWVRDPDGKYRLVVLEVE